MHLNLGHLKNRHLISLTGQNLITSTKPKCGGYHQQDRQIISNHSRVLEIDSDLFNNCPPLWYLAENRLPLLYYTLPRYYLAYSFDSRIIV